MTTAPDTTPSRPVWRSLLYVPVNVEKYVAKAHTRGADAIQLDLEDSVPVSEKANARKLVQEAAETVSQAGADVVVRINQPLRMAVRDLEETVSPRVQAITLTKVDSASHVRLLAEILGEIEDLLGCPSEHLQFPLWYLTKKKWVGGPDNGRYSITIDGVEHTEEVLSKEGAPLGPLRGMIESPRSSPPSRD